MSVSKGFVLSLIVAGLLTLGLLLVYFDLIYFLASLFFVPSEVVNRHGQHFMAVFAISGLMLIASLVFVPILSLFTDLPVGWKLDHSFLLIKIGGRALAFALPYYILALLLSNLSPHSFLLSFVLFALTFVYPRWISIVAQKTLESNLFPSLVSLLTQMTARIPRNPPHIGAVEIEGIPDDYLEMIQDKEKAGDLYQRFHRLLSGLSREESQFGFRVSFHQGAAQILILASARSDNELKPLLQRINAILLSYFPSFKTNIHESWSPSQRGGERVTTQVLGAPLGIADPLNHLAEYFIRNRYTGDYLAIAKKEKTSQLREFLLRQRYRNLSKETGKQESRSSIIGHGQTTKHTVDYTSRELLANTEKQLSRDRAPSLLRCWVYISASAATNSETEAILEGAVSTLTAPLSSEKKLTALRTTIHKGEQIIKELDNLKPVGRGTILLPSEAVPYFWIPKTNLGIEIIRTAEFPVPPRSEGGILLGQVLRRDADSGRAIRIRRKSLRKHTLIAGVTGSGKTNTCFHILLQLQRLGIPFLVIEPVKSEYRRLKHIIPELHIFTLGDEETAPFRLNPLEVPEGVKVQAHIDYLKAAFKATFPMYAPMPLVLERAIVNLYRKKGWNLLTNRHGDTPTLQELHNEIEKTTRQLGYEPRLIMDIEAALKTRISSLLLGAKGAMLNTARSTPFTILLQHPTIIELKEIVDDEEKALITALILTRLREHIELQGQTIHLRHVTVLEEAHRLLTNMETRISDPEAADPRRRVVEQLCNMLAESRAYGEGFIIAEQVPTKLASDAVKNTHTKIVHKLLAQDDRETIGNAIGLNTEQKENLITLRPGVAVIHTEQHPLPFKAKIPDTTAEYRLPLQVSDQEIRQHMKPFYSLHPQEPPTPPLCQPCKSRCLYKTTAQAALKNIKFHKGLRQALQQYLNTGETEDLTRLLQGAAAIITENTDDPENPELAYCLLVQTIKENPDVQTLEKSQLAKQLRHTITRRKREDAQRNR